MKFTLLNNPPKYTKNVTGKASNYVVTVGDADDKGDYWETNDKKTSVKSWGGWERMASWSDADGPKTKNTLVYDFTNLYVYNEKGDVLQKTIAGGAASLATFKAYLADGLAGIGFDPDCHFYNDGVTLEIKTRQTTLNVPAPAAVLPFALGIMAKAMRRRHS